MKEYTKQRIKEDLGAIMFLILVGLAMGLLLSGCKSIEYVPVEVRTTETVTLRDTTFEVRLVEYHDSIIKSTGDTTSYLRNEYADSWAVISEGTLRHSLNILQGATVRTEVQYIEKEKKIEVPKIIEKEKTLSLRQRIQLKLGKVCPLSVLVNVLLIGLIIWIYKKGGFAKKE